MSIFTRLRNSFHYMVDCAQKWIANVPRSQFYASAGIVSVTTVRSYKNRKSNIIILAGLSGSGKTVLFYQLRSGSSSSPTVSSSNLNEGTFVLHSELAKKGKIQPVHLIDIPGGPGLRQKLEKQLTRAAGLVFVVDALDFLPHLQEIAKFLYDILTNGSTCERKLPVLVLCNKNDNVVAHTKEFIRRHLEREIDKLYGPGAVVSADILVTSRKTFSFSDCANKVTLATASGLAGDITRVEEFIREHVTP
uniref:Signal recognition particle receptor subunit beta n=1 Tax=Kalanchoe fedtschenkoi TaxID=63787 RepID=A0A7N0RAV6_KALFE